MKTLVTGLIGIFLGLLIAGGLYLTVRSPAGYPVQLLPSSTPDPIIIYINGSVKRPGVYRLPPQSRMVDAVQIAGGFLDDAAIAQVNLARPLIDGEQIMIPGGKDYPTPQLEIGGNGLLFTPTPPAGQLLNINIATIDQLDQLPGIGPTAAQKIVDFRTTNGFFERIEDIQKVPGIGPTVYAEISGLITVGP